MDKSKLTTNRIKTEEIEIEGLDEPITVKGVSRKVMFLAQTVRDKKGDAAQEQFLLSMALVDPPMTPEDIADWQEASPFGEINEVQRVVNRLSGIGKDATKSDVPGDGSAA